MRLADLVNVADAVATTAGRNDKVGLIADALGRAGDDAALAASYLAGDPPQQRLDVGWASVNELRVDPATDPSLQLTDVDRALGALADASGPGSRGSRQQTLQSLFASATASEQRFLSHLILGEMRLGASAGVIAKAVAKAAGVPEKTVRRAVMLSADLGTVATLALTGGRRALEAVGLRVGHGVEPMLASTATSVTAAIEEMGQAVVEWKLDGARIQVHRHGQNVTVYTRNLNDITARSAGVVDVARALPADTVILDGEVLVLGDDGRPCAFQDTISAFSAESSQVKPRGLTPFFFDILHLDGRDLIEEPLTTRRDLLTDLTTSTHRIPSMIVSDAAEGEAILADALNRGHEGVIVKALDSPYAAGRRGKSWRKVKPVKTLDLVVLAVEWGSGRRSGWLSNIHLGARRDDGFVMLGKTFKGMTDEMLKWQTERFVELQTHRSGHIVHVRPEQVVEIAVDGIQASSRYPGGVALRFARVLRYRDDKSAEQADTLATVKALG